MIVHVTQIHPRDAWCAACHVHTYLRFCDRVMVAVDGDAAYAMELERLDPRVTAFPFRGRPDLPDTRVNPQGMYYDERAIRQAALDRAMTLKPSLIVFGDADEVPTPDVIEWVRQIERLPQTGHRWYAHWVNLWGDAGHAIGGNSAWSFQSPRGNKKCLAMQPGGQMRYDGAQHTGMEPGRSGGGPAPVGDGHTLVDAPKLLHLKYGWAGYADRPEAKLTRHQPAEMLRGGEVVAVPREWLWEWTAVLLSRRAAVERQAAPTGTVCEAPECHSSNR